MSNFSDEFAPKTSGDYIVCCGNSSGNVGSVQGTPLDLFKSNY